MKKQYWPAIILIFLGTVLLLDQMDIIYFSRADLFSYGFIILGVILFGNGLNRVDKKGIFGGVFFISFGVMLTLMRNRILLSDDELALAAFFFSLTLANFVYFLFKTSRYSNLIWGVIFGALGSMFLFSYQGYHSRWYVWYQIERFWPILLILIGVSIILKAYKRRESISVKK